MVKICNIEFNEANFEMIQRYLDANPENKWPSLRKLTALPAIETTSEKEYQKLEPWIQWVSVHTGLRADEHGVHRLGDGQFVKTQQIFEWAESKGLRVGVISAMNVVNRLSSPSYFIPDPWTKSKTDGSLFSNLLSKTLHQAVNDNAVGKLNFKSMVFILYALLVKTRKSNWILYLRLAYGSLRNNRWKKALFLDLFMSDLHLHMSKLHKADFTTIFLNGLAHIQHHYLFNSEYYEGKFTNPDMHISNKFDPVSDALEVYDRIFENHIKQFSEYEILISTGLRQVPYTHEKYMYRLRNHKTFLYKIGIRNFTLHPLMSSDFILEFETELECLKAQNTLKSLTLNGIALFSELENRGKSLFVTLTYPDKLNTFDLIETGSGQNLDPQKEFAFVTYKNGMHDGIGYALSNKPNNLFYELNGKHVAGLFTYLQRRLIAPDSSTDP